jgi:hypothetical protein
MRWSLSAPPSAVARFLPLCESRGRVGRAGLPAEARAENRASGGGWVGLGDGGLVGHVAPAKLAQKFGRSALMQDVNAPLAVAAAVKRDAPPVGRPGEFLRGRVGQHAAHRAIGEIQHPRAIARHLEDHPRSIRRHRGRSHEAPFHRRRERPGPPRLEIQQDNLVLVRIPDAPVVGKPRRAPRPGRSDNASAASSLFVRRRPCLT